MDDPTSRKRSRSTTPIRESYRGRSTAEFDHSIYLQLQDPLQRNKALNELLKLSNSHEANYSLSSDEVLKGLCNIVIYECLDWQETTATDTASPIFRSREAWKEPPTTHMKAWASHCQLKLGRGMITKEKMQTIKVILAILRNLSFVGANIRLLAYSPQVLAILTGCLYEGTEDYRASDDTSSSTLALLAMNTLVHLASLIDVSGQKLLSDKLFYTQRKAREGPMVPEANSFGQAAGGNWGFGGLWLAKRLDTKEDSVSDVSKKFVLSLTADYLIAVWSIFSALAQVLVDSKSPRSVMMMALDFLQELTNHARVGLIGSVQLEDKDDEIPTIRAVLVNMPDPVIQRLVDMLYVPRLGPDALDYVDPVHNIVTRVTTLKLLGGYDATVDTDVRDRALDVLVPLLEIDSPRMASRLGKEPSGKVRTRLFDALVPILTTTVGRNEASLLATQLLREISKSALNKIGLAYIQERLVELASRDSRVAHLVWNHLYVTREEESLSSEEGSNAG